MRDGGKLKKIWRDGVISKVAEVPRKMKDESEGKIIDEFAGLKWKMYSMLSDDGKESNTEKGVNIATEFSERHFN